jgi:hypothetical protein
MSAWRHTANAIEVKEYHSLTSIVSPQLFGRHSQLLPQVRLESGAILKHYQPTDTPTPEP